MSAGATTPKARILVADDDPSIQAALKLLLHHFGYEPIPVMQAEAVIPTLRAESPEAVLLDMNFTSTTTGQQGLMLLREIRTLQPHTPVLLMTAWGSIELAVEGMRCGAFDFITKPWNNRSLLSSLETALSLRERTEDAPHGTPDTSRTLNAPYIIGRSPALLQVLHTVQRVAGTEAPVLILGESGTGKELIAQALHQNSRRAKGPFVKVNLGGLSTTLFESEMFGHRKGAFTDAHADRKGRLQMAEGGTLFLDEIGELAPACQVKLLRVLQEKTYEMLGDSTTRHADVRIVCATNADLRGMVQAKTFREDLLYRINLITVTLPPLRERWEDLELLCQHLMAQFCHENALPLPTLPQAALETLRQHPFPGNIRELKNVIERAVILQADDCTITPDIIASSLQQGVTSPETLPMQAGSTLEGVEMRTIAQKMREHGGNISRVARSLGISRAALYRRLEKYGLEH